MESPLYEDDVHARELVDICRKIHEQNDALRAEASRLRVYVATCPIEIAWAAGLFEGEGSVGFYNGQIRITIKMCDEDIVRRWGQVVGTGRMLGPYAPHGSGKKEQWQWSICKFEEVEAAYIRFHPWLGSRRAKQFEDALSSYWEYQQER